jgi:putative membrane protein insertion efficiency factor
MKHVILGAIKLYRIIFAGFAPHCRFAPTCSQYTYEAVARFGAIKGVGLGIKRILKCHPFHEGGFDPVPDIKH